MTTPSLAPRSAEMLSAESSILHVKDNTSPVSIWLRPFVVESSSGQHLPFLDGLRGLAVLLVILFHSWHRAESPDYLCKLGVVEVNVSALLIVCFSGVYLFFILSGFLLSQSWLRADFLNGPRPNVRRYFKRRWYRIAPGYYCALGFWILFFIPTITPPQLLYSAKGFMIFLLNLLMLENLLPLVAQYNPTWWTIPVEMLFYCALPLVIPLFTRSRWVIGLFLCVLVSVAWISLGFYPPSLVVSTLQWFHHVCLDGVITPDVIDSSATSILINQLPTYCIPFGLGIALANLSVRNDLLTSKSRMAQFARSPFASAAYFLVGWTIVLLALNRFGLELLKGKFVNTISVCGITSVGFTLIMASLIFGCNWARMLFNFPPLRLLGLIGYSAYLWHLPVISMAIRIPCIHYMSRAHRFPVLFIYALAATIVIACFFYLTVEKPFLLASRSSSPGRARRAKPLPRKR